MGEIEDLLRNNNQEHILNMFNFCSNEQKQNLENQIKSIDFNQINNLYQISKDLNSGSNKIDQNNVIEPIKYVDKYNVDKEYAKRLVEVGETVIQAGQYAVVTMAGRSRNKIRT